MIVRDTTFPGTKIHEGTFFQAFLWSERCVLWNSDPRPDLHFIQHPESFLESLDPDVKNQNLKRVGFEICVFKSLVWFLKLMLA